MKKRTLWITLLSMVLAICAIGALASVAAANREITATVYVDGVSGDNSNDGLTAQTPVKSMSTAYAKLNNAMIAAGKDRDAEAAGKVIIVNNVTFTSALTIEPGFTSHIYTVYVEGATPNVGMVFNNSTKDNFRQIGPTVFDNMVFHKTAACKSLFFYCCEGYKTVFGPNFKVTVEGSAYYPSLVCGGYTGTITRCPDVTVEAGIWRNIYISSYTGTNTAATATLNVTGGAVQNSIGATYNATVNANLTANVSGISVSRLCASATNTAGTVNGNVTYNLGEGASFETMVKIGTVSGTMTANLTNCTVGTVENTVTSYLTATENMTINGTVKAAAFTGGGKLTMSNAAKLEASSVSGETELTINQPADGETYLVTPATTADTAFRYTGMGTLKTDISGNVKNWSIEGGVQAPALVLTVPHGATVKLYKNFEGNKTASNLVTATSTEDDGTTVTVTYRSLPAGDYCYLTGGTGYYAVSTNLYYSADDAANGKSINADPGKKTGKGWEPNGIIYKYTAEATASMMPSSKDMVAGYEWVFTTPAFAETKANHEFTTQTELEAFVADMASGSSHTYVFNLGTSQTGKNIPIVFFTKVDLSGCTTALEAAALIKADNKLTVQYQAQIHGNEPAGGEGALAMIKELSGTYGANLIEDMNIYVIPRVNPDGSETGVRTNTLGFDMNRDHLYLEAVETQLLHAVYNAILPDVTIDGHEFQNAVTSTSGILNDILIGIGGGNADTAVTAKSMEIREAMFTRADSLSLRSDSYPSYATTANYATGRGYFAIRGSLSFLIETRGIFQGKDFFERRVLGQVTMVETILNELVKDPEGICRLVDAGRQSFADKGAAYDTSDLLILKSSSSKTVGYTRVRPTYNHRTGELLNADNTYTYYDLDVKERTRVRPTAYVLPKNITNIDRILQNMRNNGITWYEIPAGAEAMLQQYSGTATAATLSAEKAVTFTQGAYVFPMNQESSVVLAMLMEPDVNDTDGYNGTLVQSGLIASGDNMPIYRYIHDLQNGKIQTSAVAQTAGVSYGTLQEAVDACTAGGSVKLLCGVTEDISVSKDLYLDLNGCTLTGNVTVASGATLYGADSTTNSFTCNNCGRINGTVTGNLATAYRANKGVLADKTLRYVAIPDQNGYTFHRYYADLTKLLLNVNKVAMGYKAAVLGDEAVLNYLDSTNALTFRLWAANGTETTTPVTLTVSRADMTAATENSFSLWVNSMMQPGDEVLNQQTLNSTVYAELSLKLGTETVVCATKGFTLRQGLETANTALCKNVNAFTDEAYAKLQALCIKYYSQMSQWDIEKLLDITWQPADYNIDFNDLLK